VDAAVEMGHITPEEKEKILKFRANPSDESWMK
jgi:orotate phosphoribosyltransferase